MNKIIETTGIGSAKSLKSITRIILKTARPWPVQVQTPPFKGPIIPCEKVKMGVSENRGTPKWMVYNGKPYLKWMIWGYETPKYTPTLSPLLQSAIIQPTIPIGAPFWLLSQCKHAYFLHLLAATLATREVFTPNERCCVQVWSHHATLAVFVCPFLAAKGR